MKLSSIIGSYQAQHLKKSQNDSSEPKKNLAANEKPGFSKESASVKISAAGKEKLEQSGEMDSQRLEEIKKRISSGFYNSDAVDDDIANKLSNILDDMS